MSPKFKVGVIFYSEASGQLEAVVCIAYPAVIALFCLLAVAVVAAILVSAGC